MVRNEEANDIEQAQAILRATFTTEAESKLVDALRSNGKAIISMVAVCDDEVLGHILFSPVSTTPPSEAKGIGLATVAVGPDMQLQGIGTQLVQTGLGRCRDLEYDSCVVLGPIITGASSSNRQAVLVWRTNTGRMRSLW